ncbi:hypothetical protein ANTQUA_LOCUS10549 [Anthophora quadrimaculata]
MPEAYLAKTTVLEMQNSRIPFLARLQQETNVVRYFVNYTMLSLSTITTENTCSAVFRVLCHVKEATVWDSGTRTLLIESTRLQHTSHKPQFWKCRIAAIQFLAQLQQETPVVRYFVNYATLSKQRRWNAGSAMLLYESTCQKHISLPPRFWKGRKAAIQFLALLQQRTPVARYFVNYTMLSKQRWWNAGSLTLLYKARV